MAAGIEFVNSANFTCHLQVYNSTVCTSKHQRQGFYQQNYTYFDPMYAFNTYIPEILSSSSFTVVLSLSYGYC